MLLCVHVEQQSCAIILFDCAYTFCAGSSSVPEPLKKFSQPWTPTLFKRSKTVRVRSDNGKVEMHVHVHRCLLSLVPLAFQSDTLKIGRAL